MYQLILLIHAFAAICIIALVLVQQGKGSTMGAGFGGGASQTVFGSRGSGSFLFRFTMGIAMAFFVTSLILNNLSTKVYKQQQQVILPVIPTKSVAPAPAMVPPTPAEDKNTNANANNDSKTSNKSEAVNNTNPSTNNQEPIISADPGQPILTIQPKKPVEEQIPVPVTAPARR